tara:strand:- start:2745 stop:3791 length:1047 start_codon:yes stop_codon:yes gene_type:complete
MKIYSYKIKINNNIQKDIQSYPFLNSKDKKINDQVINYLKSDDLEVNEKEIDNTKTIISWDNIDEKFSYEAFKEKIKIFNLENIISEKSIKNAYFRLNWKFEKINFNKKKILSLGSGDGLELIYLRIKFPESEIYSVDWVDKIDPKLLSNLNIHFEKNSMYEYLKKNQNSFDFIYAGYVLEHSYEVNSLLKSISNSLVSGGIFACNIPLISYYGTDYYDFLKKTFIDKKINQIDGGLIDLGHPWKTNEHDLYETLKYNNFDQINIFGNINNAAPAGIVKKSEFIKSSNYKFKLNSFFIKPFKLLINKLFGNNVNYLILKIYHRITRSIPFADSRIANFVPDVLFIAKK